MKLAEDLKKAVLQAAMQGKLTQQLESDSSVDEMISSIQYETRLENCSEKLILEAMDFPLPDNWRFIKLNEIVRFVDYRGKTPHKINKGVFLITASNIKQGFMDYSRKEYISEEEYLDRMSRGVTRKGDLLFTTEAPMGNASICNLDKTSCGQRIITFQKYNDHSINLDYLMFCILSPDFQTELLDNATGTTAKGIKGKKLKHLLLPLPPIEEQQRIVEKLNQILPLIDEYGKEEDELIALCQKFPEEMKKSVLQAAMQGKLTKQLESNSSVDELLKKIADEKAKLIEEGKIKKEKPLAEITEDEISFDIPKNWRYIKLGSIIDLLSGRDHEPSGYNSKGLGVPYMTGASNISNGELIVNRWTEKPTAISHLGDLLITCKGTIGEMAYNKIGDIHIARQIMGINTYNGVSLDYIQICLKQKVFELNQKAKSMIPGIAREDLLNLIVPLPPIEEQQRIVEKLNTILPLIDSMAVYGTKKKTGRPKQEEALAFISSLLGTQKSTDSKPVSPEILELTAKAKEELPAIIKKYAEVMDVTYNRITIRHQKTRWGSCTKTGNLSFNCLLMKMPENVRDYVIIHELAHCKELNHSTKFWTIVAEYCPWYKEAKLWLKENGQELMEK